MMIGIVSIDPAFSSDRAAVAGAIAYQSSGLLKFMIKHLSAISPPVAPEQILAEVETARTTLIRAGAPISTQKIVVDVGGVGMVLVKDLLAVAPMRSIIFTRSSPSPNHTIQPSALPVGMVAGVPTAVPCRMLSRVQLFGDLRAVGQQQRMELDKGLDEDLLRQLRGEGEATTLAQDKLKRDKVIAAADDLLMSLALAIYAGEHAIDWRALQAQAGLGRQAAPSSRGWT